MYILKLIFVLPIKIIWNILSFIRNFLYNVLILFLIVIGIIIYCNTNNLFLSKYKGALVVNLQGDIIDKPINTSNYNIVKNVIFNSKKINSLYDITNIIRKAKQDNNISGLILDLDNLVNVDLVSLRYLGKILKEFSSVGKPIYAIGNNYNQIQYYLASFANKIYLINGGFVSIHGISVNNYYYKSLLSKIKINSYIFRVGKYKSAVEPFFRDNMSSNTKNINKNLIDNIWNIYLKDIASNRHVSKKQIYPSIFSTILELEKDNNLSKFALKHKLVDDILSYSKFEKLMINIFGYNEKNKTYNYISIYNYYINNETIKTNNKIAIIFINNILIDDKISSYNNIIKYINCARLDDNVKSILLRINSPGGSVYISELIRAALERVHTTTSKPIVVSMGNIDASGGYWISTAADYIIADSSTITGSIGVFSVINTTENLLDYIGIHKDGVSNSPLADISINKKLPLEVVKLIRINTQFIYNKFINLVAKSRHKSLNVINNISQGRVWCGCDAMKYGLVDQIGDFDDAINKAASLAKIKQFQLKWFVNDNISLINILSNSIYDIFTKTMTRYLSDYIIKNSVVTNNDIKINKKYYAVCLQYNYSII
ncbi:MAG: signal peptide peptidase SppA [Candidatus Lightella neohaematopini]|nr:signal peptide peptidase SppA [Candidatus Lightella neohaematopini]